MHENQALFVWLLHQLYTVHYSAKEVTSSGYYKPCTENKVVHEQTFRAREVPEKWEMISNFIANKIRPLVHIFQGRGVDGRSLQCMKYPYSGQKFGKQEIVLF